MMHYCPKCPVKKLVVWQPRKQRFYCPNCHRNFTMREAVLVKGGKE